MVAAPASDRLTSVPARQALSRRWRLAVRRHRTAEVTLMLFLVVILVRPEGLLGKAEERKV